MKHRAPEAGIALVTTTPTRATEPRVVVEDVVRDDHPLRHDSDKLAGVLMRVYEAERRARSVNGTVRSAS